MPAPDHIGRCWTTEPARSPENLVALARSLCKAGSCVFRGHSQAGWVLQPSLFRSCSLLRPDEIRQFEKDALTRWEGEEAIFFKPDQLPSGSLGRLMVMQHYGCPTRLLDWSADPLKAAFFACVDDLDHDGCLWCIDRSWVKKLMKTQYPTKPYMLTPYPFGDDVLDPVGADHPIVFIAQKSEYSKRLSDQEAWFTFSPNIPLSHCDVLNRLAKTERTGCCRILIEASVKPRLIEYCRDNGIARFSLFQDPDGLGKDIKDNLRLRAHPTASGRSARKPGCESCTSRVP